MTRRLLNFVKLLSLVLCVAVTAMWVRSCSQFDELIYSGHSRLNSFGSYGGRFFVQLRWSTTDHPVHEGVWFWDSAPMQRVAGYPAVLRGAGYPAAQQSRGWRFGGFDASHRVSAVLDDAGRPEEGLDVVIVPYWFLCLVTAAPLLPWLWRHRRSLRRRPAGVCPQCGYDLRATPGRCPECGTMGTPTAGRA